MTTKINRPNPFVTVWAESNNSKKFTVYESESEAKANAAHPARASMDLGFPEITMKSAMTGGQPPWGQDHNGILNRITKTLQWIQAGGTAIFDKDLSDKIGGYPQGAILQDINDPTILWFSKKTSNTFNPKYAYDPDKATDDDGGSRTREKWWDKLSIADIKDLQERLATAEGNIATNKENIATNTKNIAINTKNIDTNTNAIYKINTAVTNPEEEVNSFPDVYAKLGDKANQDYVNKTFALKAGSCSQDFSANTMQAGQYSFCPEFGQNTIFQEIKGEVQLYTDICYRVYVKDKKNAMLSIEDAGMRLVSISAQQIYLQATEWIQCDAIVNCINDLMMGKMYYDYDQKKEKYTASNQALSWTFVVDYYDTHDPNRKIGENALDDTKDLVLTLWDQRPNKDTDDVTNGTRSFEAMRVSYNTGDISAKKGSFISNSHADIAEYYQADREGYEPGTLMCHGVDTEVTLCQSIDQSDDFFGVVSTNPAYVMNGKGKNNTNPVLIALNGKVPVKVKGIVKCGDKITIGQDGYGVVSQNKNDVIVGRAKENKESEEVGLVSCYVQAHM